MTGGNVSTPLTLSAAANPPPPPDPLWLLLRVNLLQSGR